LVLSCKPEASQPADELIMSSQQKAAGHEKLQPALDSLS